MAAALAGAGAPVVLLARRIAVLESAATALRAAGATHVATVTADVRERSELERFATEVEACFGPPDIVVNAAGVNPRRPADTLTDREWDDTIELNLSAPFFVSRRFVPKMRERGWGRIINVASLQAVRAFTDGLPYGASKGGVVQLTRAMAEAWSPYGITCNAIAPGFFHTALSARLYADPERVTQNAARTAVGRNGELRDLFGVTIFLAAAASEYVTGQTIFVDGGYTTEDTQRSESGECS